MSPDVSAPGVGVAGFFSLAAVIYSITLLREADGWRWILLAAAFSIGMATVFLELKHIELQRERNQSQTSKDPSAEGTVAEGWIQTFLASVELWVAVAFGALFGVIYDRSFPQTRETGGVASLFLYGFGIWFTIFMLLLVSRHIAAPNLMRIQRRRAARHRTHQTNKI